MSEQKGQENTINGKYVNKYLESLLDRYISVYPDQSKNITYDLFHVVTVAFLKENNEGLTTIRVNDEFRDELFLFVSETLSESNCSQIVGLVNQMKSPDVPI